ncbi:MAG: C39 family peptidase, partial [Candidatus Riflebacteria bacterium]|nr:C39 family peptidase [Candidatus Riflebacteria bacterium]
SGTTNPPSTGGTVTPGPAAPSNTGTQSADGGLAVPLMNQGDTAKPSSYCGPTSVAMVLNYYGKNIGPDGVEEIATGSNPPIYEPGGSHIDRIAPYLKSQGLGGSSHEFGKSISWLGEQTRAGNPVIVHVKGDYGPRSTAGHFVVVVGLTASGDVIINDPAGGTRQVCDAGTFNQAWQNDGGDCVVARP